MTTASSRSGSDRSQATTAPSISAAGSVSRSRRRATTATRAPNSAGARLTAALRPDDAPATIVSRPSRSNSRAVARPDPTVGSCPASSARQRISDARENHCGRVTFDYRGDLPAEPVVWNPADGDLRHLGSADSGGSRRCRPRPSPRYRWRCDQLRGSARTSSRAATGSETTCHRGRDRGTWPPPAAAPTFGRIGSLARRCSARTPRQGCGTRCRSGVSEKISYSMEPEAGAASNTVTEQFSGDHTIRGGRGGVRKQRRRWPLRERGRTVGPIPARWVDRGRLG